MNEATFEMPLAKYFLLSEDDFMERVQRFGKKQGISDGTRVEMEYSHDRWHLRVKLSWDAPTPA